MRKNQIKSTNNKSTSKEGQPQKSSARSRRKMNKQYELKPINRNKLRLMIIADPNISHIAEHFGVARSTIRRKIEMYDLDTVLEISLENRNILLKVEEKELKYCRLFMQLNGVKKIARDCKTSPKKVKEALSNYGLNPINPGKWTKVVNHIKHKNFDLPISYNLECMIISQLLGDASLRIMKKGDLSYPDLDFGEYVPQMNFLRSFIDLKDFEITDELVRKFNYALQLVSDYPSAIFRFSQGVIKMWRTEDWVDFSSILLNDEGYRNEPKYSRGIPNLFYYLETIASVQLFDLYAKWYPNNKKMVPFDLEMTPDILLYWYIGDGSLSKNSFYIATMSFSKKEVDFLCDLLFSTFGLVCHTTKHPDGFNLTISLKKDNFDRFFNYLDQANPEALVLAKKIYPWKFDRYLTKDEAIATK